MKRSPADDDKCATLALYNTAGERIEEMSMSRDSFLYKAGVIHHAGNWYYYTGYQNNRFRFDQDFGPVDWETESHVVARLKRGTKGHDLEQEDDP